MTTQNINGNKPMIYIFITSDYKDSELVAHIGYGIEEEGIPFKTFVQEKNNSQELAYNAAQNSSLGIGLGVTSEDQVVLQMAKLSKENPVFNKTLNSNEQAKKMGSNAARMVKGLPFKSFKSEE
ncbi:glycerol dehydratase reactivase beta/small subunit family protein [Halanaerobacter jeridensis]|uniref:Flavorubredoxin n=1 Tax=Halanaerobacter jeridensis TaxID=706427 RepID=A0A938XUJ6_9FIRM|nr:glycerol dehydratase reactivase beta/small subunit family protein [Halanaerobacter jeridensis]MBM7557149.1 flavorubredoxin [Halanaerobacter jeridensis]